MDHDQRFKTLIREFFADFLRLFFADWANRFDLGTVEFLEQEVFPDPTEGSRHLLDLVAKLRTREQVAQLHPEEPDKWLALVHIEIESPDRKTLLKPRLPSYYFHLREKHGLPVLPIALFLKVSLEGIGIDVIEERFWELTPLRFSYLYVGLPGLDGLQYVEGENWLGVALSVLMAIPADRIAWLGAEALRRLTKAPLTEQQRFLLGECVHAYLPMNEQQNAEFERLLLGEPYTKVKTMNKTYYEKGMEKGEENGEKKGAERKVRELAERLLAKAFGPLPQVTLEQLRRQSTEQLEDILDRVRDANSLNDLGLDG